MTSEYWDLRKKYENSVGYRIYQITNELHDYKYFMDHNLHDLIKGIEYYEKNWSKLWIIKSSAGDRDLDDFMIKFMRVLYNYLNTTYSLYDKTKGWRDSLNNEFSNIISQDEYDGKIREYKVREYGDFIREARNNFTHKTAADQYEYVSFSMSVTKEEGEKPTIDFTPINKQIKEVAISYNKAVTLFHKWFINKLKKLFIKEINEAKDLNIRIMRMQGNYQQ